MLSIRNSSLSHAPLSHRPLKCISRTRLQQVLLRLWSDVLVVFDLQAFALAPLRRGEQILNVIAPMDLVELPAIIFDVLEIEPGVQRGTDNTDTGPEK